MELGEDGEQDIGTTGAAEADKVSQAGDLPTGDGGEVRWFVFAKDDFDCLINLLMFSVGGFGPYYLKHIAFTHSGILVLCG